MKFYLTSVSAVQPFIVVLTVQRSDCSRLLAPREPRTVLPPTDATSGGHCLPCSGGEGAGKMHKQGQGWRPEPRSGSGSKCLETEYGWEEGQHFGASQKLRASPQTQLPACWPIRFLVSSGLHCCLMIEQGVCQERP